MKKIEELEQKITEINNKIDTLKKSYIDLICIPSEFYSKVMIDKVKNGEGKSIRVKLSKIFDLVNKTHDITYYINSELYYHLIYLEINVFSKPGDRTYKLAIRRPNIDPLVNLTPSIAYEIYHKYSTVIMDLEHDLLGYKEQLKYNRKIQRQTHNILKVSMLLLLYGMILCSIVMLFAITPTIENKWLMIYSIIANASRFLGGMIIVILYIFKGDNTDYDDDYTDNEKEEDEKRIYAQRDNTEFLKLVDQVMSLTHLK